MKKTKVCVIVVNYKSSELIPKLLESLKEDFLDLKILILDNATTDETWNVLEDIKDERAVFIKSDENLGFTGGVNHSVNYALENFSVPEYLFLLNPDALCKENLIYNLVEIIKSNEKIAAVSPQIFDLDDRPWYAGAKIQYKKGIVDNYAKLEFSNEQNVYEIDVFSGCAVLFDTKKFIEARMFEQELFMYYDEADLSIRLTKLGYKLFYAPYLSVKHDVSYTTKKISHIKTYFMTRNKLVVFKEHIGTFNKYYFLVHELAFHLKNKRMKCAYYHLLGYWHCIKGIRGGLK